MKETSIREFVVSNLPPYSSKDGKGHRITFKAVRDGKQWTVNIISIPVASKISIAVKDGTKGKTETTRQEWNYLSSDNGFRVDDNNFKLTKLA